MGALLEQITEWLKGMLVDGINPEEIVIPKKDRHSFDFSL